MATVHRSLLYACIVKGCEDNESNNDKNFHIFLKQ